MLSWTEILVVASIGVLVFSAKKLPSLGKALRDSLIDFKKGLSGVDPLKRNERDVTPKN